MPVRLSVAVCRSSRAFLTASFAAVLASMVIIVLAAIWYSAASEQS